MAKRECVFFDCDGVLVNTEPIHYRAFLRALNPYKIFFDYSEYKRSYIGYDDRDAFKAISRSHNLNLTEKDIGILIGIKNKAILEEASKGVESFDGVENFVVALYEKKANLAVVSGSLGKEVRLFLRMLGILDYFCFLITAEDVKASKPDPESYVRAHESMECYLKKKINPYSCVVFEDTPAGIEAARGAGMYVVAVAHSFGKHELGGAHRIIDSFRGVDLEDLLGDI